LDVIDIIDSYVAKFIDITVNDLNWIGSVVGIDLEQMGISVDLVRTPDHQNPFDISRVVYLKIYLGSCDCPVYCYLPAIDDDCPGIAVCDQDKNQNCYGTHAE
jgi:hypothetical protein